MVLSSAPVVAVLTHRYQQEKLTVCWKGAPVKILLVDDDQPTRDVLDFALALEGHHIQQAADGFDALVAARESRPDLIVLDSMMPVMDGITTVKHLRRDAELRDIPVLMLTAKVQDQDQWEGWSAGVDSYLSKPLDVDVLRAEIDRISNSEVPS